MCAAWTYAKECKARPTESTGQQGGSTQKTKLNMQPSGNQSQCGGKKMTQSTTHQAGTDDQGTEHTNVSELLLGSYFSSKVSDTDVKVVGIQ